MGRMTGADNVAQLFPSAVPSVSPEDVRIAEALVFAAAEPLEESTIAQRLSERADVGAVMEELRRIYEGRGVNLVQVARRWMFRTADDLSLGAGPRPRREAKTLARGARNARHCRLSPTRHPRRYRTNPWRGGVEGRARRAHGGALGAHAGTPKGAGSAHHLRHDDRLSGRVRTERDRGSAWPRRA